MCVCVYIYIIDNAVLPVLGLVIDLEFSALKCCLPSIFYISAQIINSHFKSFLKRYFLHSPILSYITTLRFKINDLLL